MKFRVLVTPEAQTGIRESFEYIHQRSPLNAASWLQGLYDRIDTLEELPERCSLALENKYFEEELRQYTYKSHRVVFRVERAKKTVLVLYVRHARRRAVGEAPTKDK